MTEAPEIVADMEQVEKSSPPLDKDTASQGVQANAVEQIIHDARALMADEAYTQAWDTAKYALELELRRAQPTAPGPLDCAAPLAPVASGADPAHLERRAELLRELFAGLVGHGKAEQATETISLSRAIRLQQAALLGQEDLITQIDGLIRDARLLHSSLRDIEAWPLLQEAAAMRPMVRAPALARVTMSLAGQLVESAIVFHCSSRSAMAREASEIVGSMRREMSDGALGYYASELQSMLEKLPIALAQIAQGTNPSLSGDTGTNPDNERPSRVLIVDDSALMLDMAKEALEAAGYSVDVAQVLSQIADEDKLRSFDLILMDVMMPELHGDDVAVILRGEIEGLTAPIYFLSSLGEDELAARANQAGVDGFISKRAGIDALVQRVDEILSAK